LQGEIPGEEINMRIDSNQNAPAVSENSRSAASPQAANSSSSTAGSVLSVSAGEDQAQLSGAHVLVQALAAQASQLPEVRQEKVSALRQAVQNGDYRPDPEQVAGALFSHLGASSPGAVGETDWRTSQEWAAAI
jgi:flagellar biosynthesis anti-sigma factor FlgM